MSEQIAAIPSSNPLTFVEKTNKVLRRTIYHVRFINSSEIISVLCSGETKIPFVQTYTTFFRQCLNTEDTGCKINLNATSDVRQDCTVFMCSEDIIFLPTLLC